MKGLRSPHLLLIGNPYAVMENLRDILDSGQIEKIRYSLFGEVRQLYKLSKEHFDFAVSLNIAEWRQRSSRFYYAAYTAKRAVALCATGRFVTDVSDHKDVDVLPDTLSNRAVHASILKQLRDDRNLADYSHLGVSDDLLIDVVDVEGLVSNFMNDCELFLKGAGVQL